MWELIQKPRDQLNGSLNDDRLTVGRSTNFSEQKQLYLETKAEQKMIKPVQTGTGVLLANLVSKWAEVKFATVSGVR